ncbi:MULTISPECIES: lytic polysaccharide monooxygenase auxiliary activity family 9 protein [unclassified Kitasatospora]|uniref:lytic polysaccharide monooxygenase auxiliary activity family 9 protein n=1 Tax=unclassified Kitasatospora TaxID=2633591 RepID=UPI00340F6726
MSKEQAKPGTEASTMSGEAMKVRHGRVTDPASRAALYMPEWIANEMESGKFFPATQGGLADPVAPDDVRNDIPPMDGRIASANRADATQLDEPMDPDGREWRSHEVVPGQSLAVVWNYAMAHKTRRWNYFITEADWDPAKPLSRAQFEPKPFHSVELTCQPYWSCGEELNPPIPTTHTMVLPTRTGHQVLLAVWEVADTARAFYQVIDLKFTGTPK